MTRVTECAVLLLYGRWLYDLTPARHRLGVAAGHQHPHVRGPGVGLASSNLDDPADIIGDPVAALGNEVDWRGLRRPDIVPGHRLRHRDRNHGFSAERPERGRYTRFKGLVAECRLIRRRLAGALVREGSGKACLEEATVGLRVRVRMAAARRETSRVDSLHEWNACHHHQRLGLPLEIEGLE
jgi:hypothetical protein